MIRNILIDDSRLTDAIIAAVIGVHTLLIPYPYQNEVQNYLFNIEDPESKRAIMYGIENY